MIKRWGWILVVCVFLAAVFFLSNRPFEYDIWFHLKSGEIIAKMGLIRYDVFSQAAGRAWYPYEWLFQLLVYYVQTVGGLPLVTYFIATLVTVTVGLFLLTTRKIYNLPRPETIAAGIIFYGVTYWFYVSRPLALVYVLFLLSLFIILLYVKQKKNYLWTLVPITLVWGNIHGSMFFPAALAVAYGVISWIEWLQTKMTGAKKKSVTLGVWALILFACTFLPPVGLTQYRLLYLFWVKRYLISFYILEWQPLDKFPTEFWYYTGSFVLVLILMLYVVFRQKKAKVLPWILPFLPFVAAPYLAMRNAFFGYTALSFIALELSSAVKIKNPGIVYRIVTWSILTVLCLASIALIINRRSNAALPRPEGAVSFIKNQGLRGAMYNEFGIGGYLLYHLYPDVKVYFDGRADVYLCCEIPDDLMLNNIAAPFNQYKTIVDGLMEKYHVTFALIGTGPTVVRREVAQVLAAEPAWHLVYWDDTYSIFVKEGMGNDAVIAKWGLSAATPLGTQPYLPGSAEAAKQEYERIIALTDSATSRNALAAIYYTAGNKAEAAKELTIAAEVNPKFDATYVAMANIAINEQLYDQARVLLIKALSYNNQRGLTYIQLAALDANYLGDRKAAHDWLTKGLENVIDIPSRDQLTQMLKELGK